MHYAVWGTLWGCFGAPKHFFIINITTSLDTSTFCHYLLQVNITLNLLEQALSTKSNSLFMKQADTEKDSRGRESKGVLWFIPQDVPQGWGWGWLKLGIRNSTQLSCVDGRIPTTEPWLLRPRVRTSRKLELEARPGYYQTQVLKNGMQVS